MYYVLLLCAENSRTCEVCNVIVHRASFVKHLRSKKHLKKIEESEMIIPDWLFKYSDLLLRKRCKKYIILNH